MINDVDLSFHDTGNAYKKESASTRNLYKQGSFASFRCVPLDRTRQIVREMCTGKSYAIKIEWMDRVVIREDSAQVVVLPGD